MFGAAGAVLAIIYTAPPIKLDYRGLGLGEISILFAFGPLPALGSYYVQSGHLSLTAFLLSVPIGLMTVTILVDHDTIFYEVYKEAAKMSLATILGRKRALRASLFLSMISYGIVILLAVLKWIPVWSLFSSSCFRACSFEKVERLFKAERAAPILRSVHPKRTLGGLVVLPRACDLTIDLSRAIVVI